MMCEYVPAHRNSNITSAGKTNMSFLFPDHDGRSEVDMNNDQKLVITGLEEQVLDVAEQDI